MRAFVVMISMLCLLLQFIHSVAGAPQAGSQSTPTSATSSTPRPSIPASSTGTSTQRSPQRPAGSASTPIATKRPIVTGASSHPSFHTHHSLSILRPTSITHSLPTIYPDPQPQGNPAPQIPQNPHQPQHGFRRRRRLSVVAIVFVVLAGVAGIFIGCALLRCLCSYKRTPDRDRIATLLDRHYLEREMEERERVEIERRLWRATSLNGPPPPPYQQAPAYEEAPITSPRPRSPSPSSPPPPPSPPPPSRSVPAADASARAS